MSVSYIEDDVRQYLSTAPAVAALVPASQVYPAYVRSDAIYPCISITTVGSTRQRTLDETLIIMKRIQVDCWSPTFPGVKNLESIVTDILDGFTGYFVADSFRILTCDAETILDSWSANSSVYRVMIQFEIEFS